MKTKKLIKVINLITSITQKTGGDFILINIFFIMSKYNIIKSEIDIKDIEIEIL